MKNFFLGKKPIDRKYAPKILEYFFQIISSLFITIVSIVLISIFGVSYDFNVLNIFNLLNNDFIKILFALLIAAWLFNLVLTIHILVILPKTIMAKWLGYVSSLLSLTIVFSFLAIGFAYFAYKKNEIYYQ